MSWPFAGTIIRPHYIDRSSGAFGSSSSRMHEVSQTYDRYSYLPEKCTAQVAYETHLSNLITAH